MIKLFACVLVKKGKFEIDYSHSSYRLSSISSIRRPASRTSATTGASSETIFATEVTEAIVSFSAAVAYSSRSAAARRFAKIIAFISLIYNRVWPLRVGRIAGSSLVTRCTMSAV